MEKDTVITETKQNENENTETAKSEKLSESRIMIIILSISILIIAMIAAYWFYAQERKAFEETISNITVINENQENSINSALTIEENNKSTMKALEEKIASLENNLNNSMKTNKKLEKELGELTNKNKNISNTNAKDIKSDDEYYIIKKPLTPVPTDETVTLPTTPIPTNETVTLPTVEW